MFRHEIENYKSYEILYGDMYHLLLNKLGTTTGIKFVSNSNYPLFASLLYGPVFFDSDKNFRIAIDYTIVYPKIYVKKSVEVKRELLPLSRSFIH